MSFKNYNGGGGPEEQLVAANNLALANRIRNRGVECSIETNIPLIRLASITQDEVKIKGDKMSVYIGYDRWGFCAMFDCCDSMDTPFDDIMPDQAGLDEAVKFAMSVLDYIGYPPGE